MKKFFITLAILAASLQVQATDSPIFWRNCKVTPHNECGNLYIVHSSFVTEPDKTFACFAYYNESKAKLNGKPFVWEVSCYVKTQGQLIQRPKSRFVFSKTESIETNPYYFRGDYIKDTVSDFLEAAKIGMWTDYD